MKTFEKLSTLIRHLPLVEHADWFWNPVRPIYERAVGYLGRSGLERTINGSDRILVSPRARRIPENYEPDVWRALMNELRAGDTFVDVGAFVGFYAIAAGVRLRGSGRVIAFEPDRHNFSLLQEHVRLNKLEGQVGLHCVAISNQSGLANFLANGSPVARLVSNYQNDATMVEVVTLDRSLAGQRIDILKIDVEGYEEMVLRGAQHLLRSPERRPRVIFVEVHPYAWPSLGTTSESLLALLCGAGYQAKTTDGEPVRAITQYGEIIATIAN